MSKSYVRTLSLPLIALSVLLLHCSQSPQPTNIPAGSMTGVSDCLIPFDVNFVPDTDDCVAFSYDGEGTLLVSHLNTAFNCCPIISAEITISGDTVVIEEIESLDQGGCSCLCLFNIDYEITDLSPGEYTLKLLGNYLAPGAEPLEAQINLNSTPTDTICVFRGFYPWDDPLD